MVGKLNLLTKSRSTKQADVPQSSKASVVMVCPSSKERRMGTRKLETGLDDTGKD